MADGARPNTAGAQLLAFVERIERLDEDRKAVAEQRREVLGEAKGMGFDRAAILALVKERAEDPDKRAEREAVLELYRAALGGLADLPLGHAAMAREAGR